MLYRVALISLLLLIWWILDFWSVSLWIESESSLQRSEQTAIVSESFLSWLSSLTGIVLAGPRQDTWERWSSVMWKNQEYIKWRLYDLTDKNAKKFLRLQSDTSPISLIMENRKFQQYGNDFKERQGYFTGYQVELFPDQTMGVNFTHAKTFVGDTRWAIQTANLTHSSLATNVEHFFLWTDREVRDDLLALFELDQSAILTKGKKSKKSYTDWIESSSPNLLVCPLNCRSKIEYLLTHAKKSIRISQQYITDPSLLSILEQQQKLDIRIKTNDMSTNYPLVDRLWPQRVHLAKKPYSHDKMMIIDGSILMIWSMNFSDNALDNNREIGILTTDEALVKQVETEFKKW